MSDFQFKEQQSSPIGISRDVADTASTPLFRTTATLPTLSPNTVSTAVSPTLVRTEGAATYLTPSYDTIEILDVNETPTSSGTSEGVSLWLGTGGDTRTPYIEGSDRYVPSIYDVADIDEGAPTSGSADGVSLWLDSASSTADNEQLPDEIPVDTPAYEQPPVPLPTEMKDEKIESQTTDETPTTTSASKLSDYLPWILGATGISASIFIAYRMLRKP
jgi:hypothetical protein